MIKPSRQPYGYQNLLVYKKAEDVQKFCQKLTELFPKMKTLIALADQMNRSARSTKQNIVEGWKRNSTKEYYEFLGFSIGSNAELEEDCNDIWKGIYPELMGIRGLMGERGKIEERGEIGVVGERGKEKREETGTGEDEKGKISSPFSVPSSRSTCFPPFDIEALPFYPLDRSLPPIVRLKLMAKELNFLLSQLQKSLVAKMENEKTLGARDKMVLEESQKQKEREFEQELAEKYGLMKKD